MKYYYLIATLPDLSLEAETTNFNFGEVIDTIQRNLGEEDQQTFKYLIHPHDNGNLLNAIFKKHHGLVPLPFQQPSIFDQATIEDYVQERYNFPDYMSDFLVTYQERFSEMGIDEIEYNLLKGFYQEVSRVPDTFVVDYYQFEKTLRSMVAAFNRTMYPFVGTWPSLEDAEVTDKLANEGSGMSILAQAYPFITPLREAIHSKSPRAIEETIDEVKWGFIDNYGKGFFSNQHVYSYVLKLFILQRRASLAGADRDQHFERLIDQVGGFKQLT